MLWRGVVGYVGVGRSWRGGVCHRLVGGVGWVM